MGRYVVRGLSEAGANQYLFLKSQGAHNTSGAVPGAGNTNAHRPVYTFKELRWSGGEGRIQTRFDGGVGWPVLTEGLAAGGLLQWGDVAMHLARWVVHQADKDRNSENLVLDLLIGEEKEQLSPRRREGPRAKGVDSE